jgi:FkbM family methyltransferase
MRTANSGAKGIARQAEYQADLEETEAELDKYLSTLTRRIGSLQLRGAWRLIEPLRRFYAARFRENEKPSHTVINDFDGDLEFQVDRASYIGGAIYWLGYHSLDERILLSRIFKPTDVFCDIGANIGELTTYAARRVPTGHVLAFEPASSVYQQLLTNIQLNGFTNVSTYNLGLSDKPGDFEMYTSSESADLELYHSHCEGQGTIFQSDYRSVRTEVVRMERFDDVFAGTGIGNLDVVKIDVEGAELLVLRGAYNTLKRYKPKIILEINEETYNAAGYSYKDVFDFLKRLNYDVFLAEPHGFLHRRIKRVRLPEFVELPPLATLLACQ